MDKATKTKIILFASLGIFVLVVLAVTLALTGKGDNREEDGSVNTSLRAAKRFYPGRYDEYGRTAGVREFYR